MVNLSDEAMDNLSDKAVLSYFLAVDILFKLPAKSLVRFKSISKSWNSFLTSSAFVADHLRRSKSCSTLLVRRYSPNAAAAQVVLILDAPTFPLKDLVVPLIGADLQFPKIAGSTNGLVCLDSSPRFSTHLAVWNPATRQFRPLPITPLPKETSAWKSAVGFGFNPDSDEYFAVRVLYYLDEDHPYSRASVEAFSLRTGSWAVVQQPVTEADWVIQEPVAVSAIGALHWMGTGSYDSASYDRVILCLDLSTWRFKQIYLPEPCSNPETDMCVKLYSFQDTIAVTVHTQYEDDEDLFLEFYVLDPETRWSRLFQIRPFTMVLAPVAVWRDSEIVLLRMLEEDSELFTSDPANDTSEHLKFLNLADCALDVFNHVESIVSVF